MVHQEIKQGKVLKQPDAGFREMFDHAPDAYLIMDIRNGSILNCNQATVRMLGGSVNKIIGKTPDQLSPEFQPDGQSSIEAVPEKIAVVLEKGYNRFEWVHQRFNGNNFSVEVTVSIGNYQDNKVLFVAWRENDEVAVSRNLANLTIKRMELAQKAADLGVWFWNLENNELNWDERMFEIYQAPASLKKERLFYEYWRECVHQDDLAQAEKAIADAVSGGQPFDTTFRIIVPSGETKYIQSAAILDFDPTGKPLQMIGINRDITEFKLLEKARKEAKEKAESANQQKSQFLSNMSHELRTPMHAIMSFSALALKHAKTDKVIKFLGNINKSGERLTNLLDGLLDLSKLESAKMIADFDSVCINDLIKECIDEVDSLIQKKSLLLENQKSNDFICEVDKKLITQVIINLLSNAIKFSPEGSRIILKLEGSLLAGVKGMQFSIIDEGLGIPGNELEDVFDSFIQSSKTRSKSGGTGLGLAISQKIIDLHNGYIWAESPPKGKEFGTCFSFRIPLSQSSTSA